MARQRSNPPKQTRKTPARRAPQAKILSWSDDPGSPDSGFEPMRLPVSRASRGKLVVRILDTEPAMSEYPLGTGEFRYWVAAEALARGVGFWSKLVPRGTGWVPQIGAELKVKLDKGENLNAYYDRSEGLAFYHATAGGRTVYTAESPDVVLHELGHAVLDSIRPQLYHGASIEGAAFHESFGDMSALLCSLQLERVRADVIAATSGDLSRSSRLSRVAEQLGWAIRQAHPDSVDPDCLRNAANSLFYRDPATLPPRAPASALSSQEHSFSRVFTAAFLTTIAGMFRKQATHDKASLKKVSVDAGQLLVDAILSSPVVPSYYSQLAAHLVAADARRFQGRYTDVIKSAFVRQGILALDAATTASLTEAPATTPRRGIAASAPASVDPTTLLRVSFSGARYGLQGELRCESPAENKRYGVAGAALSLGSVDTPSHDRAAELFIEDLFRRGRIDIGDHGTADRTLENPYSRKTHELQESEGALLLTRRHFDCGFSLESFV